MGFMLKFSKVDTIKPFIISTHYCKGWIRSSLDNTRVFALPYERVINYMQFINKHIFAMTRNTGGPCPAVFSSVCGYCVSVRNKSSNLSSQ